MDGWDPFASSEVETPGITISDLSWPPIDSTTSAPNAPPASGEAEAGALEWPDLSAQSSANNSGQEIGKGFYQRWSEQTFLFYVQQLLKSINIKILAIRILNLGPKEFKPTSWNPSPAGPAPFPAWTPELLVTMLWTQLQIMFREFWHKSQRHLTPSVTSRTAPAWVTHSRATHQNQDMSRKRYVPNN